MTISLAISVTLISTNEFALLRFPRKIFLKRNIGLEWVEEIQNVRSEIGCRIKNFSHTDDISITNSIVCSETLFSKVLKI